MTATGPGTEMGRIGKSLGTIEMEATPLQRQMRRIVVRLAVLGAALCLLVAFLYGRSRGSLFDGLLAGLALAMSILPEEFPVVLTIFLALALAGSEGDGTITWMTGPKTLREHTVPRICEAASKAGRRTPRVVVGLPIAVTNDATGFCR